MAGPEVEDYRFTLSDGTYVWVIVRGKPDDRIYQRLHESVERVKVLRSRTLDKKPGKLRTA